MIFADRFKVLQMVVEGSYGKVYAVQDMRFNNRLCALKTEAFERNSQQMLKEVQAVNSL